MKEFSRPLWSMLVISLPGRRATPRMRVWRALKGLGAVVLRDGVYLLPHSESAVRLLQEQADAVRVSGATLTCSVSAAQSHRRQNIFARCSIVLPITRVLSGRFGR